MPLLSVKSHYQKVKAFYKKYERLFMPALIIWGFVYHYITFKVIPINEVLYLVFGYLALATIAIFFINLYDAGKVSQKLRYVRLFMPLVLQFTLGSIIGGVFIFYWFSGSIFVSWPFIALIVLLVIAIEVYKQQLEKPVVQFSIYYFASVLLLAVALPYFLNSINQWLFVAAGSASFILVFTLAQVTGFFAPELKKRRFHIVISSAAIFIIMALFYFYNLIPPVPLSVRETGIYHDLYRSGSVYVLKGEPQSFWQKFDLTPTIHLGPGERAFAYTAIYSPADLHIDIIHDWQHYDPDTKQWVSVSKLSFPITGGRQDGYRGYSEKTNLAEGAWRVYIETPRGQVLGRLEFDIQKVATAPALETIKK